MEKNSKTLITVLITIILILAIPVLMYLVGQTQIFKPRAAGEPIQFTGPNVTIKDNSPKFKLNEQGKANVGLIITSPLGPPVP